MDRQFSLDSSTSSSSTTDPNRMSSSSHSSTITEVYPPDSVLPKTVILRLIREATKFSSNSLHSSAHLEMIRIHSGVSVSDEALFAIQKHAHDFVSFITHEANEKCSKDRRKTITGDDIVNAFNSMGFDNYARVIQIYYHKWKIHRQLRGPSSIDGDLGEDGF